jgi:hypothetical protein
MKPFWTVILLTTLLVGTNDIIFAYLDQFIKTGKFADKMLFYMAGGALGLKTSMQGGFWIGALGLLFHYIISLSFTLLFFLVYPILKLQYVNKYCLYAIGILYGPFVGCFMRFIVLPMTRLPQQGTFNFSKAIVNWLILGVVFGLPIAISASRYYRKRLFKTEPVPGSAG